jgi:hypothetical protein
LDTRVGPPRLEPESDSGTARTSFEADETYVNKQRGRAKAVYTNDRAWVKTRDRYSLAVFALVERGGRARATPIDSASTADLHAAL